MVHWIPSTAAFFRPLSVLAETAGADRRVVPSLFEQIVGRPPQVWESAIEYAVLAGVFVGVLSLIAMFCIWWERKVAGHMQCRPGPNRVGPIGLLQSLADGLKLLLKEDLVPPLGDGLLFRLAPYIAFAPVFAAFLAVPFGPNFVAQPSLSVGVFWILAMLSVEVMGVILAGWASNNKWSVYGAMREACQMVSYEIPLGISIIIGVMTAGTLNMLDLGHMQGGGLHTWLVFRNPFAFLAFFVYFIASLASNKRAPFDLPESESELVAGFHTEYSGLRWSFFFFAEYGAMFIVAAIQSTLFLGAWQDPFGILGNLYHRATAGPVDTGLVIAVNVIGAAVVSAKCLTLIFVQMWLRWTLPRPRIDQVLYACVKVLLPLACVLLLGATLWQLLIPERAGIPWEDNFNPLRLASWSGAYVALVTQIILAIVGVGLVGSIVLWILYAFASGRNLKQRLTDPAPIVTEDEAEAVETA
jgi:NADH-quinone oxidoreductase subunit H